MPHQAHLLSDDTLRRIGYRLLCSVYAEYEWKALRRDDDPDVLDDFLADSDSEISQLLVSVAALARASDDALDTLSHVAKVFPQGVGTLRTDSGEVPLSPREACNKILHAQALRWDFSVGERNPLYENYYRSRGADVKGAFKHPMMIVSGELRGKSWEAALDVVPFVIAVANWDAWKWKFG
jgi:hypothetical protein